MNGGNSADEPPQSNVQSSIARPAAWSTEENFSHATERTEFEPENTEQFTLLRDLDVPTTNWFAISEPRYELRRRFAEALLVDFLP